MSLPEADLASGRASGSRTVLSFGVSYGNPVVTALADHYSED